jgi:hypothetical protein
MMTKTSLTVLGAVASLALLTGCPKKDSDSGGGATTTAAAAATPGAAPAAAAPAAGEVAACPTQEVPQGGTVKLLHSFAVHQAPDPLSARLTNLGPGTFVDLKGSCGNWMKIMYPIGPGQLGPGWVELREIQNPTAVQTATPPPPPTTPTTTAPATTTKVPPPPVGRPPVVIPKRK